MSQHNGAETTRIALFFVTTALLTCTAVPVESRPVTNKAARDRVGALKLDLGGALTDGLGLEFEFGRDVSMVVRGKYLGAWPHLNGAFLHLTGTALGATDEDDPELLHWIGGGLGVQFSWSDYDQRPKTIIRCEYGRCSPTGEKTFGAASTIYLRFISDYMLAISETEGTTFSGSFVTTQAQFGARMYVGHFFIEAGVGGGVLLNLSQDRGRKLQWASIAPMFSAPLATGFVF